MTPSPQPSADREPHYFDVTWTMRSVPVVLPDGMDPDGHEASELASEKAADKLRDLGPDEEEVECVEEP